MGKSALAIKLAQTLDGEVVNADSLSLYKYLDIGTAKPTLQERERVPHHLIDFLYPDQEFDAYHYAEKASEIIKDIQGRGKVPIIAGGTGLYMKALYDGLPPGVGRKTQLRKSLLEEEEQHPGILYTKLREIDPWLASTIHPHDRIRIIRALEIIHLTGKTPRELWRTRRPPIEEGPLLQIALILPRADLYANINARVQGMVERGLIEETERLLNMGYPPTIKPLQAIGYREALSYLKGLISKDRMVKEIQKRTRNYAKRQIAWFKREGFTWLLSSTEEVIHKVQEWIEGNH